MSFEPETSVTPAQIGRVASSIQDNGYDEDGNLQIIVDEVRVEVLDSEENSIKTDTGNLSDLDWSAVSQAASWEEFIANCREEIARLKDLDSGKPA